MAKCRSLSLADAIRTLPGYDPYDQADGYEFIEDDAQYAIDWFEAYITHTKGELAGQPYILEPHERAIMANIFGWKHKKTHYRRYKEVFYFVPRKNSKTTFAAGLALEILFTDDEQGAECYCGAADRDQATLLFGQAAAMVRKCPEMDSRVKIYATGKSIVYEETNSSFKAISAEAGTKHGYNSSFVALDELHAQRDRELVDVLLTSTGSRRQPLVISTTTSDYQREGSICNEKHDYASKVRDGIIDDPTMLPVIYEASLDDDWTDPEVWAKANPNLDKSISLDYIRRACEKAKETPTFENTFKRLHLNIRTEQDVRWLSIEKWDKCDFPELLEDLEGKECWAGLDLSSTTDLTALVLAFPVDDKIALKPFFWVPGDNARKRERRDRAPYLTWARQGFIELTDGNVIDYDLIRKRIGELHEKYNIKQIAIDRWAATQLITQLEGDGFDVMPFGQGFHSMGAPTKEMEKLVLGEQLATGGHPVLRWCASNVTVEQNAAGDMKPNKAKSTERIDGIVAAIMAIGAASARIDTVSVYESRGLLVI